MVMFNVTSNARRTKIVAALLSFLRILDGGFQVRVVLALVEDSESHRKTLEVRKSSLSLDASEHHKENRSHYSPVVMFQVSGFSMSPVKEIFSRGCVDRTNHQVYFCRALDCRYLSLATFLRSHQIYFGKYFVIPSYSQKYKTRQPQKARRGPLSCLTLLLKTRKYVQALAPILRFGLCLQLARARRFSESVLQVKAGGFLWPLWIVDHVGRQVDPNHV